LRHCIGNAPLSQIINTGSIEPVTMSRGHKAEARVKSGSEGERARSSLEVGLLPVRESDQSVIHSMGWIDIATDSGVYNIHPPSDLFLFTLRIEDGLFSPVQSRYRVNAFVFSVKDRAVGFELAGRRSAMAVSLTALGLLKVLGPLPKELLDRPLPVEMLLGDAEARRVSDALHRLSTLQLQTAWFARWLEQRTLACRRLDTPLLRVAQASQLWSSSPAEYGIRQVAAMLGVGVRQLERDFSRIMHLTPGAYRRIAKFQRAAADVSVGSRLLDAAVEHGFADQAHMSNVFRQYSSLTPGALARDAARPHRDMVRAGLGGRILLLDVPYVAGLTPPPQTLYTQPRSDSIAEASY
jgi:AraC-like DNA-binding protein